VYLPTDYGTSTLLALGELDGFIDSQSFDHIIIGGDFNVDFNRSSGPLNLLSNFMADHDLVAADCAIQHSIGFTYERDDGYCRSWPDHFLCNSSSLSVISHVCKVDSGSNLSDHHPIAASLSLPCPAVPSPTVSQLERDSVPRAPKIAWHRATHEHISAYCDLVAGVYPQHTPLFMQYSHNGLDGR